MKTTYWHEMKIFTIFPIVQVVTILIFIIQIVSWSSINTCNGFSIVPKLVSLVTTKSWGRPHKFDIHNKLPPACTHNTIQLQLSSPLSSNLDNDDDDSSSNTNNDEDSILRDELKRELLLLASITSQGRFASQEEATIMAELVSNLESLNPTNDPASNSIGSWDLCLASSNTKPSRIFPFLPSILSASSSSRNRMIIGIDSLVADFARTVRIRQVVDSRNYITTELDLLVGIAPLLRIQGTLISRAEFTISGPNTWKCTLQDATIQVNNNNNNNNNNSQQIPSLLFLPPFIPQKIQIPIAEIYNNITKRGGNNNKEGSSNMPFITFQTFYVDQSIRIVRDSDNSFYVFSRS